MLRKRIIFCLNWEDGYFIQSRNFNRQRVGDYNWLLDNYRFKNTYKYIDELIINDLSLEKMTDGFLKVVSLLRGVVHLPITVGGGISNFETAKLLFNVGADKIVINSALFDAQQSLRDISAIYGKQSLVGGIDYRRSPAALKLYSNSAGNEDSEEAVLRMKTFATIVGELLLRDIDLDGTGFGYNFEVSRSIREMVEVPLLLAGGCGNGIHLAEGISEYSVDAVVTSNLFNFIGDGLLAARSHVEALGLNVCKRT
jgi:imidazole glycerol-phosphate synthase subunit HisF